MAWVKKDDAAALHPKFFRAGVAAYGWWDAGLGYCNRNLSDGFIPARDLPLVFPGAPPEAVLQFVEALMRERSLHVATAGRPVICHTRSKFCPRGPKVEDGYVMHDYFEYQFSRSQALKRRRKISSERSAAGRKGGVKSGETRKQVASVLLEAKRSPDPTRPDPTLEPREAGAAAASNGSLPTPIQDALGRCSKLGGDLRVRRPDYWRALVAAYPGVDYPAVILDAESYLTVHPNYRDMARFLRGSVQRAHARLRDIPVKPTQPAFRGLNLDGPSKPRPVAP